MLSVVNARRKSLWREAFKVMICQRVKWHLAGQNITNEYLMVEAISKEYINFTNIIFVCRRDIKSHLL